MVRWLVVAFGLLVAACTTAPAPSSTAAGSPPEATSPALELPPNGAAADLAFVATNNDRSGNRLVDGAGTLPSEPAVIALDERPAWVLAAPVGEDVVWIVAGESGAISAYTLDGGGPAERSLNLDRLPPGTPPAALASDADVLLLAPPGPTGSVLSHPLALGSGGLAFIAADGSVVAAGSRGNRTFPLDALLDGRLVESSDGLLAVLTGPTDSYPHGVLGDDLEASRLAVVDPASQSVVFDTGFGEDVIEGVAPLWTDADGDGVDEVVVTLSNAETGARIAIVGESGTVVAESAAIGRGSRWRHVLAVGPLGPNGEMELVEVVTPHLGGIVTFRSLDPSLSRQASLEGFTSHVIGSRNLDMAVAADADGNGRLEVVLPSQARTELAGVERVTGGVSVAWIVDLGARMSTNIAAAEIGGRLVLGVGTEDGRLLVWQ